MRGRPRRGAQRSWQQRVPKLRERRDDGTATPQELAELDRLEQSHAAHLQRQVERKQRAREEWLASTPDNVRTSSTGDATRITACGRVASPGSANGPEPRLGRTACLVRAVSVPSRILGR